MHYKKGRKGLSGFQGVCVGKGLGPKQGGEYGGSETRWYDVCRWLHACNVFSVAIHGYPTVGTRGEAIFVPVTSQ
jgi:hypothetical protein